MSFWQKYAERGAPQAPQPPQPVYPAPGPLYVLPVAQQPVQQQPVPVSADPLPPGASGAEIVAANAALMSRQQYATDRAMYQTTGGAQHCPSCGEANMFVPYTDKRVAPRCLTCGYNDLHNHSTQGISATTVQSGPATAARGQNNRPAGAPPMNTVVGHV